MLNLKIRKQQGFTVAELVIVLAVIGVIAAISIITMKPFSSSMGDKLHNKITHEMEFVAAELYADHQAYAENAQTANLGFRNTTPVFISSKEYQGDTKFCELFMAYITDKEEGQCTDAGGNSTPCCYNMRDYSEENDADSIFNQTPSFITSDGIKWWLPKSNFARNYDIVYVDADSKETSTDCMLDSNDPAFPSNKYCADGQKIADRFKYYVFANGIVKTKTTQGEDDDVNKYKINVKVTVKKKNPDGSESSSEVTGNILDGDVNSDGGKVSLVNDGKNDIVAGGGYTITATPKANYDSDWVGNVKRVILAKKEITVNITFTEVPKYKLTVDMSSAAPAQFARTYKSMFQTNCEYVLDSSHGNYYAETIIDEDTDEAMLQYNPCENLNCNGRKKRFKYVCEDVSIAKDYTNKQYTAELKAGTYHIEFKNPSYRFDNHQTKWEKDFTISTENVDFSVGFE